MEPKDTVLPVKVVAALLALKNITTVWDGSVQLTRSVIMQKDVVTVYAASSRVV